MLFLCCCWTVRLLKAVSFRNGLFYDASIVTCLESCCCKSCKIYLKQKRKKEKRKKRLSCLPDFIFTNLRNVQIVFGLQPYLPGSSSFTKLLPCQHPPSLFFLPHATVSMLKSMMLFSLHLSLTILHGKYLAADACDRLLSGHVGLPLS